MLKYDTEEANKFVRDMHVLGAEVEHYHGRFFWEGPAVRSGRDFDMQEILGATKVKCQWDSMGLDHIIYPYRSAKLIEE